MLDTLLFQGKVRNGFFIEAGASDMVYMEFKFYNTVAVNINYSCIQVEHSNTLWYELKYNWTGLLIEPVLKSYRTG